MTVTLKTVLLLPQLFDADTETAVIPTGKVYGDVIVVVPTWYVSAGVGVPVVVMLLPKLTVAPQLLGALKTPVISVANIVGAVLTVIVAVCPVIVCAQ